MPVMQAGRCTRRTLPLAAMTYQPVESDGTRREMRAWTARLGTALSLSCMLYAVVGIVAARAGTAPQDPDLFDELFRKSEHVRSSLRTLTARVTETTTSSMLTRPLVEHGSVALIRPSRVLLTYTSPEERTIVIDGDRLILRWPSRGLHETKDIGAAQRRIQRYFVDAGPDELRSHFRIHARTAASPNGAKSTYLVTMVPKRKQILQGITQLELWVDHASFLPTGMRLTFPSGDTKLMTFEDVELNPPVDWDAEMARQAKPPR
jgi:outer membrane lipoprotein-sorting protein